MSLVRLRFHDTHLRVRRRPLPRSGDEPRGGIRRREGDDVRGAWAPSEPRAARRETAPGCGAGARGARFVIPVSQPRATADWL
jgi:hypothetical protein